MPKFFSKSRFLAANPDSEKGSALVIAILIMLLMVGFVTIVISRVSGETVITTVDTAENRTLSATQAVLESTSRDVADVFGRKLSPTNADIAAIRAATVPGFSSFDCSQKDIYQTKNASATEITGGTYAGLYSLRDEWEIDVICKEPASRVETQVKRRFLNDRIPLFQFGIFYEDDLELNRPPLFTFGGRVHTNSNFFVSASPTSSGGGIYFKSKATAVGEVVNDIWKTGGALTSGYDDQGDIFVADAGGTFRELDTGKASVKCVSPSGANVFAAYPNLPYCSRRSTWVTEKAVFQGNLETNSPRLDLPLYRLGVDLVELTKRSKNIGDLTSNGTTAVPVTAATMDPPIVAQEKFANKQGLRITLADSKQKLPGCANNATLANDCGVRLDGTFGSSIGYQPLAMTDGYQGTPLNATRMAQTGKEIWIKVEIVDFDYNTSLPVTKDITAEFLSLGLTERPPIDDSGSNRMEIQNYSDSSNPSDVDDKDNDDIRSIIKMQRFAMEGPQLPSTPNYTTYRTINSTDFNMVVRYTAVGSVNGSGCSGTCTAANGWASPPPNGSSSQTAEDSGHLQQARFTTGSYNVAVVPFPIELFDTREGIPSDATSYYNTFSTDKVPRAGLMSMVDIDVGNLRKFFNGGFDGKFPTGTPYATAKGSALVSSDVPENKGWVLFLSDRRGDFDFDGEYDMEDVFPDNTLQFNEDVNNNGVLDKKTTTTEAPTYSEWLYKSHAAVTDHGYYRRGFRLVNGSVIPGNYPSANPTATKGFTVSSENGIYVLGNYNATGVTLSGTSAPAPSQNYQPQNTSTHIPAAIIADAPTILSNAWNDSKSFVYPFDQSQRNASATQVRFALLAGDGITGKDTASSYNPSSFGQLNGGIHNFKRYLERWTNVRLNYAGSLVNLFNSRNNNGFWKCCNAVYNPPIRDWTFDSTFLDPNRLPPGTPFIYALTFTGYQRVRD